MLLSICSSIFCLPTILCFLSRSSYPYPSPPPVVEHGMDTREWGRGGVVSKITPAPLHGYPFRALPDCSTY